MKNENSPYKGGGNKGSMLRGHCRQYRMQNQHPIKKQVWEKADSWDYYLGTADALWLEYSKKFDCEQPRNNCIFGGYLI